MFVFFVSEMKTNITAINEESRSKNLIILFVSCSKELLTQELLLLLLCQGQPCTVHNIVALYIMCCITAVLGDKNARGLSLSGWKNDVSESV